MTPWKAVTVEQPVSEELQPVSPSETHPCWSYSWRSAAFGKNSYWRSSGRAVSQARDLTLEQVKNVHRKEQQKKCEMNWPQLPFQSLCTAWEKEVEKLSGKLSLRKRERQVEAVFRFGFISQYPILIWLVVNLCNFSESILFCLWWKSVNDLSLLFSQVKTVLLHFLSPV